jgi:hypothetical protein
MHRSRLSALIIDCRTDSLADAAGFWSRALGREAKPSHDAASPYIELQPATGNFNLAVQKVDHPSRVHLDIEADDVEAEVSRLERLGARRIAQVKSWWVLEAPTGQRFCVVPAHASLEDRANRWA